MQGIAAMTATTGIPVIPAAGYRAARLDGRGTEPSRTGASEAGAEDWAPRDPMVSPAPESAPTATEVAQGGQGADGIAPESADPAEADTERPDTPAQPWDAAMVLAATFMAAATAGAATPTAAAVASAAANATDGLRLAYGAGKGDPATKAVPQGVGPGAAADTQAVVSKATTQPQAAPAAAGVLGRTPAGAGLADAEAGPAAPAGEATAATQAGGERGTASSASVAAAVAAPKASGQDAASSRLTSVDSGAAAIPTAQATPTVVGLQGAAMLAEIAPAPGPRGTKAAADGSESREVAAGKGESTASVLDGTGGRAVLAVRIEEAADRAGLSLASGSGAPAPKGTGTDALKAAGAEASPGGGPGPAAGATATAVAASPASGAQAAEPQAPAGASAAQTAQTPGGGPSATVTDQLAASVRWMAFRDGEHVTVRLQPPELGKVRITFRSEGQEVRGILEVENASTLARLGREMPALAQRLQDAGVQVRRLEVALDGSHDGQASPFSPYDDRGGGSFGGGGPDVPSAGDLAADGEPVGAGLAGQAGWVADAAINVQA